MTVEADIVTLLKTVVSKAYPDVAPIEAAPPYAVYQQVGGESLTFLGREVPSKKNGRFQISIWAATRLEAAAKALAIENAFLITTAMQATPLGSPVATYEDGTKLYGTRQDFSVWSDR